MIYLITGAPGTGKTAKAVSLLLQYQGKRPIYNMGIPDLKVEHFVTPAVENWTEIRKSPEDETIELPYFTFPENAVIIIDEAQRVYRPRSSGVKVPPHVAAFETHRHTGVDFILITQSEQLIDSNIRRLVGKHVHIRATSLGRYQYEWSECGDTNSTSSRAAAIRSKYTLPKEVFGLYKSAELHTKIKKPIHPGAVIVGVAIVALLAGGYYMQRSISAKISPDGDRTQDGTGGAEKSRPEHIVKAPTPVPVNPLPDFTPRDPDSPITAPAYDAVRQVKNAPRIAACVASASRCICYTQTANPLNITEPVCRSYVRGGYFDPYNDDGSSGPRTVQTGPEVAASIPASPQILATPASPSLPAAEQHARL